jgi:hypothetical protein
MDKQTVRLSASVAKVLLERSPLHAWQAHRLLGGGIKKTSESMERGKLLEKFILGADLDKIVLVDAADWRTKAAKEAREAAEQEGKQAVLAEKYNEATEQAEAITKAIAAQGVVFNGESQVRVEWNSPNPEIGGQGEGVPCSGYLDHLVMDKNSATIYDLKIVENASPASVQRMMTQYGYDIQHAAYLEAVQVMHPELAGRVKFKFVFCEPEAPHACNVAELAGSMAELGTRKWYRAVSQWGRCVAANQWPGYLSQRIEAASWQLTQEQEQEFSENN